MNRSLSFTTRLIHRFEKLGLWYRHQLAPSLKHAFRDFYFEDDIPNLAASLAFFALLSFIPLLILIIVTLGYVLEGSEAAYQQVLDLLDQVAPHVVTGVFQEIRDIITFKFTAGWISAVILLWAGSRVFEIMESALNDVWSLKEDRPFIQRTALAIILVPGMVLFLGLSMSISALYSVSQQVELPYIHVQLADIPILWNLLGNLIPVMVSIVGFYFVYRLIAATHVHRKDAFIGAVTAAILWEIIKRGYDFWVTNIWAESMVFGSLGTMAVFVIWVYLSCMILLFGAEVAYNWQLVEESREDNYDYLDPAKH
jgi:membrane protein